MNLYDFLQNTLPHLAQNSVGVDSKWRLSYETNMWLDTLGDGRIRFCFIVSTVSPQYNYTYCQARAKRICDTFREFLVRTNLPAKISEGPNIHSYIGGDGKRRFKVEVYF